MLKPVLVVMAAGAGSRFGGLKQIRPVDQEGHAIIDFSLYDARRAGFQTVVFIIKHAIADTFREAIGQRMEGRFQVEYVFQELDALPTGFTVPEGRNKPWGTGHAIGCCRTKVKGPFAVINADDFYGPTAFQAVYDFLTSEHPASAHAMVGYRLRNTLTEHGYVSRGLCHVQDGFLTSVVERLHIEKRGSGAVWMDNGAEHPLTGDETVSMNLWGFSAGMAQALWDRFPAFLESALGEDPLKREYFLPDVVGAMLRERTCTVNVLPCEEVWHGVTYQEDLQSVQDAVAEMKKAGIYPEQLWE